MLLTVFAVMSTSSVGHKAPAPPIGSALADYHCIWTFDPDALVDGGVSGRQAARGCPGFVDRYAVAVTELNVPDNELMAALPGAVHYQRAVADQFHGSDAVLINEEELTWLAPSTVEVLHEAFHRRPDLDGYQLLVKDRR